MGGEKKVGIFYPRCLIISMLNILATFADRYVVFLYFTVKGTETQNG